MNNVKLPQYIWHNQREVEFPLPDNWMVTVHNITGSDRPAMSPHEIKAALTSPIGTSPLREIARNKKEVVILFDDMTRGTRPYEIIPFILEELAEAGITDDRIRFIAAVGNHQAMDRSAMAKKLGEDIVSRYSVFNHCPFLHTDYVGTSSFGTKAFINSEVMRCDLKIAIGSVFPHVMYGFGGGGKIIVPGVASYDTVKSHHQGIHEEWQREQREKGIQLKGTIEGNSPNNDAREIAAMVGIDMLINCLPNGLGETAAIFAGALEPAYTAAVQEATKHYLAVNTGDNDIVIANAFIKASEYGMAGSTIQAVNPQGGSIVFLANSPAGQVVHYLFDRLGKPVRGEGSHGPGIPPYIKNYIIYTEYPEAKMMERFAGNDKALMTSDWTEVIDRLKKSHCARSKVAVYPNADTLYFD
jgi:nickel-dependent lactate racemase